MTTYRCGNRRCQKYHQEFSAMDIADAKLATGRGVSCNSCGQVAWFIRKENSKDTSRDKPIQFCNEECGECEQCREATQELCRKATKHQTETGGDDRFPRATVTQMTLTKDWLLERAAS